MKLTVIGKYGPYAKSGSHAASCYLVSQGETNLVMDMGPGSMSRLTERIDIEKISAVFISHLHYDHTSDLLAFRYRLEELNLKIKIITQTDDTPWCALLLDHPLFEVIPVKAGDEITVGDFRLKFYDMNHTVPCLAVRIEGEKTLVYTGDTVYNDNIITAARGSDLLLADTSKPAGFKGPHMNVEIAKELSAKLGIQILSTHLSPGYDPQADLADCPSVEVAQEGKEYEI
jgi:ribonuclease BN (tRNA processing enzyme)